MKWNARSEVTPEELARLLSTLPRLPLGMHCRILNLADTELMEFLRREVVSRQLAHSDCYRLEAESPDFLSSHLGPYGAGEKGFIAGLFNETGELIGYGALTLPGSNEPNLGDRLGLPQNERDRVAYLASAMLRADWRGLGLHRELIRLRLILAEKLGRRHALAATWPGNHFSWGNLAEHGLLGRKLVQVGEGLLRLVAHRDLEANASTPDPTTVRLVPLDALSAQGEWFDKGYCLWRRCRQRDEVFAELALPKFTSGG
jgi:GNAT superfamily N-acetyltransferase